MMLFRDSTSSRGDGPELLRRIREDGYLFLRGVLPEEPLEALRREFLLLAREGGWLQPGTAVEEALADPSASCVEPESKYYAVYHRIYRLESFHALPHDARLVDLFERIFGEPVLLHPRIIGRLIFPRDTAAIDYTTPAHQDYPHIQGTEETFTAWIPLSDCPRELGPLTVAEGTHRAGVRTFRPALGAGGLEVIDPLEGRWRTGDFRLGDVLIFHSLTVHKALPNLTNRLRISVDFRYQRRSEPINRECLLLDGSPLSWEEIYRHWQSKEHQYYWERFCLTTVPFDRTWHEMRDAMAFELAEAGERTSISALQRIVSTDPDALKRDRAAALLARLQGLDAKVLR